MTDRATQLRDAKAKERKAKRDAGLVRIEVWVLADKAEAVRAAIKAVAESPQVTATR